MDDAGWLDVPQLSDAWRVTKKKAASRPSCLLPAPPHALEESVNDDWLSQMPQRWLAAEQPDSMKQLLQRPVWLEAWRRGKEERAALLWSSLPDDVIEIVLDFHEQQMRRHLAELVCWQHIRVHCSNCRRICEMHPAELMVAEATQRAINAEADSAQQCVCQ